MRWTVLIVLSLAAGCAPSDPDPVPSVEQAAQEMRIDWTALTVAHFDFETLRRSFRALPRAFSPALSLSPSGPDCDACATCGRGADTCRAACQGMIDVLADGAARDYATCIAEDPCSPQQAWGCLDGLACADEGLIGGHCDALARCAMDGRGFLDEAACRAEPYIEPQQWACLKPDRRARLGACLDQQQCADLEPCLNMAACDGEPSCLGVISTRLTVDCYRICQQGQWAYDRPEGGNDNTGFRTCFNHCDQAALRLADPQRRVFETCALQGRRTPVVGACVTELACGHGGIEFNKAAAEERCGVSRPGDEVFGCLGEVLRAQVIECYANAACADLGGCLAQATCGDTPDCLAFAADRRAARR